MPSSCTSLWTVPDQAGFTEARISPGRTQFGPRNSGRAGVIGRRFRVKEENSRTVALCGVWYNDKGWKLPDSSHTLVEAYSGGWAWSVPVSVTRRYVAFMLEPRRARIPDYQAELGKTRAFRRIFALVQQTNDAAIFNEETLPCVSFLRGINYVAVLNQ